MKCNPWVGGSIGRRGFPMLGTGKRGLSTYVKDIFRNGEQGFFYDPNDLSTMYQDAAGTIPVTAAGQPVGLILDKSKGLALGAETIINGDFANGTTGWVSGTNWTATLGTSTDALTVTTNSANGYGCAIQAVPLVAGKTYKITGKYRSSQGGNPSIGLGLDSGAVVRMLVSNMTSAEFVEFSAIFTHTSGSLILYNNTTANGVVSEFKNVSIKEFKGNHAYQTTSASRPILRNNAVTGAYYLEFDGTDDSLQTNSIDFTTTDKVSLFAGVRKLGGEDIQTIVELSANVDILGRAFKLSTDPTGSIYFVVIGTSPSFIDSVTKFPATLTFTAKASFSPSRISLNINGNTLAPRTANMGSGNFGNYPLYIGRRAGAVTPFNGHIYGLIGIGKLTSDSETVAIEKELAKRTGVTLNV